MRQAAVALAASIISWQLPLFLLVFLSRIVFYIVNASVLSASGPDIWAFLRGLRFDLATTTIFSGILIPLLVLGAPYRRLRDIITLMQYFLFMAVALILMSGILYFSRAGKHISTEITLLRHNGRDISLMLLSEYGLMLLLFLVFACVVLWNRKRIWRANSLQNFHDKINTHIRPIRFMLYLVSMCLVLLVMIVAIRGGLQTRPLRPADAFADSNQARAGLSLNSAYTLISALASTEQALEYKKPDDKETQLIRSALQSQGETFPLTDFAFYRKSSHTGPGIRKNIVLIIMESWSAADIGACGARKSLTPAFDRLAQKGMLFKNAYAAGSRSIASLSAIVSSLPPLFGRSYITSAYEQNSQTGIADILRKRGYATIFAYAARSGSMGFDSYARLSGFETIITRDSFEVNTPNDQVWGIYDHITFARLHSEISKVKKPFLATFFSLNPHSPYRLPDGYDLPPHAANYSPFEKAMIYSDLALESFMQAARKSDWYENTIFVFTADHTFAKTDVREKFRIPLLIFTPDRSVNAGVSEKIVSQADILPTIIDLLKISVHYAAAGKSVFGQSGNLALSDNDNQMLLFTESEILQALPGQEIQCNNLNMKQSLCIEKSAYFKALYNALAHAYTENRIAP